MRAVLDEDHASELANFLIDGGVFQDLPVVFRSQDKEHYLAHGFHRCRAYEIAGQKTIEVEIIHGELRDAILFSVGANREYLALPRKQVDIRNAVMTLLNDPEWSKWTDAAIARHCGVDPKTVGNYRERYLRNSSDSRKAERNGTVYTMDTSQIGSEPEEVEIPHGIKLEDIPPKVRAKWKVMPRAEKKAVLELIAAQMEEKKQEGAETDAVPQCSAVIGHGPDRDEQVASLQKKLRQAREIADEFEGRTARAIVRHIGEALVLAEKV